MTPPTDYPVGSPAREKKKPKAITATLKEIRRDLERLYTEGQKAEGVGIYSNLLAVEMLNEIRRIVKKIKKMEGKIK